MRKLITFLTVSLTGITALVQAQAPKSILLKGSIYQRQQTGQEEAVVSARVSYPDGNFAFTDAEGKFSIEVPDTARRLMIRFKPMGADTIVLTDLNKEIKLVYPAMKTMRELVISQKRFSTEISLLSIQKTERISSRELLKAACCNLSESFETTPSVDVAFTDAVTGYRQIQLLGLAGPYTLITRENIPEVRGLAAVTGLTFTPGQWIEGMQLSKGSGSVVNGYEGLAGQINIEWRKPMEGDRWFANLYQSNQGRTEFNAYTALEPMEGLYTNFFVHGKSQWLRVDQNHDHFLDQPLGPSAIVANRWMLFRPNGLEVQAGIKYNHTDTWSGTKHYDPGVSPAESREWGMKGFVRRLDAWSKIGKMYKTKPWKSMGLQLAFNNQTQDLFLGRRAYLAEEQQVYANYIFQTIIGHTGHVLKAGATAQGLVRRENFDLASYRVNEQSAGVFTEYAHTFSKQWNTVIGLRLDHHNLYGWYLTPRFHVRYAPHDQVAIRGSVGRSFRSAAIFAENPGVLASARQVIIYPNQAQGAYGLGNEDALNTGVNATWRFKYRYRPVVLSFDYYYTHFLQLVVPDWEDARYLRFYHTQLGARAHSVQVQADWQPVRKFDVRVAARYHDVQVPYDGVMRQRALNAPWRAFLNLAYETRSKWSFDYTLNWTGSKRLPSAHSNPESLQWRTNSPSFITMNMHVNKKLNKVWDLYAGVENLMNVMQQEAFIDPGQPFGTYFDGSLIWGPMMGRNIYVGLRFQKK